VDVYLKTEFESTNHGRRGCGGNTGDNRKWFWEEYNKISISHREEKKQRYCYEINNIIIHDEAM